MLWLLLGIRAQPQTGCDAQQQTPLNLVKISISEFYGGPKVGEEVSPMFVSNVFFNTPSRIVARWSLQWQGGRGSYSCYCATIETSNSYLLQELWANSINASVQTARMYHVLRGKNKNKNIIRQLYVQTSQIIFQPRPFAEVLSR